MGSGKWILNALSSMFEHIRCYDFLKSERKGVVSIYQKNKTERHEPEGISDNRANKQHDHNCEYTE